MVEGKPFIHLFKAPTGFYIYDVNKNRILKTERDVFEVLMNILNSKREQESNLDTNVLAKIEKLKRNGFLSSNHPKEIEHFENDRIEHYLERRLSSMTLQVTQNCNLKCRYCPYACEETNLQRGHSPKRMSFELAKRSIDFLLERSVDSKSVNIGFYGGEPLLEFDLIRRCIEYAVEKATGKEVTFNITNNGTLMDNEKMEFLVKHNCRVLISLDGPRDVHDRNRRYIKDGSGSFDTIMNNIDKIKEKHPEYIEKISFSVVIDPENDYTCTDTFFSSYETIKGMKLISTFVSDKYSTEKVFPSEDFKEKKSYDTFKLYLYLIGKIDKNNISNLAFNDYLIMKKEINNMVPITSLPEKMHHSGPCVPGSQKMFVDVEGNILPCEKVSEMNKAMRIGHIDTGFDVDNARRLLNIGKLTEKSCKNCWAIMFCNQCALAVDNGECMSAELKRSQCPRTRLSAENNLKNYVVLKELGCNVL